MNEQREAVAEVIWRIAFGEPDEGDGPLEQWLPEADAVIAHLWEQAMKPEVVEALAQELATRHGYGDMKTTMHPYAIARYVADAKRRASEVLTALLGPNPNEQEATDAS